MAESREGTELFRIGILSSLGVEYTQRINRFREAPVEKRRQRLGANSGGVGGSGAGDGGGGRGGWKQSDPFGLGSIVAVVVMSRSPATDPRRRSYHKGTLNVIR